MDKFLICKNVYNELIEKGFGHKDIGKLTKKVVTDKNGKQRTVYVKNGEDPKKEKHKKTELVTKPRPRAETSDSATDKPKTPTVVSASSNYSINQEVNFAFGGNTLNGKITAIGGTGVTIHDKDDNIYHVNYNAIGKTTKNSNGTIPADSFNANDYKSQFTDKLVTPDDAGAKRVYDLLKADPEYSPELIDKIINETKTRLDKQDRKVKARGDTEKAYSDGNGNYIEPRQKLHKKIIDFYLSDEKVEKARPKNGEPPRFIMLGGRGGSGKSWFTDVEKAKKEGREVMFDPENFIILDADAIKEWLKPPYEGWNAGEVHEESSFLNKMIKKLAMEKGCNIIIDGTMAYSSKKPDKVKNEMLGAKEQGYRIEAHYMFLPVQESSKRAVMRFANAKNGYDCSGRLVPMNILTGMQDNEKSFDSVKDIVDDWSFRDNNVARGEQPKLVSKK